MLGWLHRLLGVQKRREWTDEEKDWQSLLKLKQRQIRMQMLEDKHSGSKGIASEVQNIKAILDLADELRPDEPEQQGGDLNSQIAMTVLDKMMGKQAVPQEPIGVIDEKQQITENENLNQVAQFDSAIKSGQITKRQAQKLLGEYYDLNAPKRIKARKNKK